MPKDASLNAEVPAPSSFYWPKERLLELVVVYRCCMYMLHTEQPYQAAELGSVLTVGREANHIHPQAVKS